MNLKSHLKNEVFTAISESAKELDVRAFVVGGYVRDLIMERASKKDIDIVVEGSGIELAKKLARRKEAGSLSVFKNFGTAMVKFNELEVEFVGARKESYRKDSRKPIIENGTLDDDNNRRDFTINALSLSLNKNDFGELNDPFSGLDDIKKKIIRTPLEPSLTYSDDPLRMMRAIRFSTQFNFEIEEGSLEAIKKNRDRLKIVSMERIVGEFNKIISSPVPSVGFKLLYDTELLQVFFPKMVKLQGIETIEGKTHKDNFYHTLQVLDNVALVSDNLWLRWAAILHDIAKPDTKRFDEEDGWTFHGHEDLGSKLVPTIFKNLKLPLDHKMKYVQKLVRLHLRPIAMVKDTVSDSGLRRLLYDAGDHLDDLMMLCEADVTSKNEKKVKRYLKNFKVVRQKLKTIEEKDHIRNFQPPVSGKQIMKEFNLKPGKKVGMIKDSIKDAILDGEISNDYDEAMSFMYEKAKELGVTS